MSMRDMTLESFTAQTASKAAVPGGGSVAALCGALAASLSAMVASLTIGKKGYEDKQESMQRLADEAERLRKELLEDIDRDCACFEGYIKTLSLPKDTEKQKTYRAAALQKALISSAEAPLAAAERALLIMPLAKIAAKEGNKGAVTDALISAMLARTAVFSALLNVKINLGYIKDAEYVEKTSHRVKELEEQAQKAEKEILSLSEF